MAISVSRARIVPYASRRTLRSGCASPSSGPLRPVTVRLVPVEISQQSVHIGRRIPEIEELGLDEALVDAALNLGPKRIEVSVQVQDDHGLGVVAELLQGHR